MHMRRLRAAGRHLLDITHTCVRPFEYTFYADVEPLVVVMVVVVVAVMVAVVMAAVI